MEKMQQRIVDTCRRSNAGADLLIAAFVHAIRSYRRASVCTPFPSSFLTKQHHDKDFACVEQAIRHLPRIEEITDTNILHTLPVATLDLLDWLLKFRHSLELVTDPVHELVHILPKKFSPWNMHIKGVIPDFVIKINEAESSCSTFDEVKAQNGSIMAFHGTSMENLHSILRCGLINFSDTEMQKNGAMYGEGIYLSTDPFVALAFSNPTNGWLNSMFGPRLRCVLLCEIAIGNSVAVSDTVSISNQDSRISSAKDSGISKRVKENLGSYIVVRGNNLVKVRYIFLYRELSSLTAGSLEHSRSSELSSRSSEHSGVVRRVGLFKVVIVIYCLLLLGIGLINSTRDVKATKVTKPWKAAWDSK